MARAVSPITRPKPAGPKWHNSTTLPQFYWMGDTSSDDVTGHMFALPLMYSLVAQTQAERDRVSNLILVMHSRPLFFVCVIPA
jgi:hypothetical protein